MPEIRVTYPGVHVEEIPSGVRPISAVDTAITAFVGRALRGPVDEPVELHAFADFERVFGGLWLESALGFAVRDFFRNGGSTALVVRVFRPGAGGPQSGPARLSLGSRAGTLTLVARSPGRWGGELRASVQEPEPEHAEQIAEAQGLAKEDAKELFTLHVRDRTTDVLETFADVTVVDGPRRIDEVLRRDSELVEVEGALPTRRPPPLEVAASAPGSDGVELDAATVVGDPELPSGLRALDGADLFNLLCIPPYTSDASVDDAVWVEAAAYCEERRAVLLVDPAPAWASPDDAAQGVPHAGLVSKNAALYFPRVLEPNPLRDDALEPFAPCGAVAGVIARTDAQRGVWKAPAGTEATLRGVAGLSVALTNAGNGRLNSRAVNCLRKFASGGAAAHPVIWGARTLAGDDDLASEWKYLPVRRTALFIEESIYRGTQWAVFEPNDEPLWSQLRLTVGQFMHGLFRRGAFRGASPSDAYLVLCDAETTTASDVDNGVVNLHVGFAPLKPAEFVLIHFQLLAGRTPNGDDHA